MKKLLRFILIFTVIFNIYSCGENGDCCIITCEKDTDCKENEICNYYSMCELNPCLSMNCGEGICELDELSTAYCKCNEGFYLKDKNQLTETCIAMPECHSSEECWIDDNNGVVLHSCVTGNICSGLCNNDNDCIGENEYCLISETERICYPVSECVESQYFSFATYICESKGCDSSSSECPEGFVYENRECVKTCSSDEDCLNYKWANGDICNSQTLTCGNVQIIK